MEHKKTKNPPLIATKAKGQGSNYGSKTKVGPCANGDVIDRDIDDQQVLMFIHVMTTLIGLCLLEED